MNTQQTAALDEIRRLLAEAYEHYFAHSDGHCKSGEGAISFHYPAFFWRTDEREVAEAEEMGPSLSIYSYVLGPHRDHYFKNVFEALHEVRKWHASEMAHDYSEDMW